MPNNQNARKAMRQADKRRLRNRSGRTQLKTLVKKVRDLAAGADIPAADAAYRLAVRRLDQAADKHLIHANKASRLKSRLSKRLAKQAGRPTPPAPATQS